MITFDQSMPLYRISGKTSQRPCDNYFNHNCDMLKSFADRVREKRKERKLSQQRLAKRAGVSQTTISDIERGRNDGSRELLEIAKALGTTAEYLAYGDPDTEAPEETAESAGVVCVPSGPVAEFEWTYNHVTDEGKKFLMGAVAAAKSAFIAKGEERRKTA